MTATTTTVLPEISPFSYLTSGYNFIQLQQSSGTNPSFSVQEAFQACPLSLSQTSGLDGDSSIYRTLYKGGCVVNGKRDCLAACQDPDHIFANPYTLQNCMVLLVVAANEQEWWLIDGNASSAVTETLAIALDFSIDLGNNDTKSFAANVNKIIGSCYQRYCDISRPCPSFDITSLRCNEFGAIICETVKAPLNADIGGIGVSRIEVCLGKRVTEENLGTYFILDAELHCHLSFYSTKIVRWDAVPVLLASVLCSLAALFVANLLGLHVVLGRACQAESQQSTNLPSEVLAGRKVCNRRVP